MKAAGTKSWDLNQILSDNVHELELSLDSIHTYSYLTEDYAFSSEEIHAEADRIRKVGLTIRLVVEKDANGYALIGPLLPYLALQTMNSESISCIVRRGDMAQVQQVLATQMNASYASLSPLVMSRLIVRLQRLYTVIKSVSGMNPGIKREWIAGILGISSSAVLRYSYISKVPVALQLRCNQPDFPYLCLRDTLQFTPSQYNDLLSRLIHYELHSRYQTITSSAFKEMIHNVAISENDDMDSSISQNAGSPANLPATFATCDSARHIDSSDNHGDMPALFDALTTQYYDNLTESFADRFDDDIHNSPDNPMFAIARKDGYYVPDQTLRDLSYQLYCLSQMRITGGQRLLDYACLRSIIESLRDLYSKLG